MKLSQRDIQPYGAAVGSSLHEFQHKTQMYSVIFIQDPVATIYTTCFNTKNVCILPTLCNESLMIFRIWEIISLNSIKLGAGIASRYSDWLRAGRPKGRS
jgi:hypothetical protein